MRRPLLVQLAGAAALACAVSPLRPASAAAQRTDTAAVAPGAAACGPELRLMAPPLGEPTASLGRIAELAGSARPRPRLINDAWSDLSLDACGAVAAPLRRLAAAGAGAGARAVQLLPLTTLDEYNSAYPRDRDNGALWAGRGVTAAVYGGAAGRWGALSAALYPGVIYEQNAAFDVDSMSFAGFSPFIDPSTGQSIDLPQRFGNKSYRKLDPGQSFVRLDVRGLRAEVGTQNMKWGPAIRNPLMLSYTAAGFPHALVGTSRPLDIGIGRFEGRAVWGRLTESPYFDGDPTNDHRLFAGVVADYEPRWLPGLFLGLASIYEQYPPPGGFALSDYLSAIGNHVTSQSAGNKPGNGLAAIYGRWAFPSAGFEAYVEWGRDDYGWNRRDLLMEPDHSQVYTAGFQKVVPGAKHWVRILGELTHLESAQTLRSGRGVVTMYTHGSVIQGHTEQGQMLGPAIGPGSDAQFLGVDLFTGWGATGGYIERVRYNDNAYYDTWARFYGASAHDVELTGALRQSVYWGALTIRSELTYSYRLDRNFLGLDGVNRDLRTDYNLGLRVGASWWPGARGRVAAYAPASRGER